MAYTIPPGETDIVGTLTRILADIDVRLKRAQEAADTLPAAEREFRANALKRISADLAPMVDTLRARIQRGVLTATSDTEVLLVDGIERTWILAEADRASFAPSPFVMAIRRLSMADTALLRVTGWDTATGGLTAEVIEITGNPGPHADWEFISGPGVITAQRTWLAQGRAARDAIEVLATLVEGYKTAAAGSATATGLDRIQTGNDRVATGNDRAATLILRNQAVEAAGTVDTTKFLQLDGLRPLTGRLQLAASAAGRAAFNLPAGTDPSAPAEGDAWNAGGTLKALLGSVTRVFAFLGLAQTWTARQTFAVPLNLAPGGTAAAPADGDLRITGTGVFARYGGAEVQLADAAVVAAAIGGKADKAGTPTLDDFRTALIQIAKLKGSTVGMAAGVADDFKDATGASAPYAEAAQSLPAMTSDTAPSGHVASASTVLQAGYEAFRAFDQSANTENMWHGSSATGPQWLQRKVPAPIKVTRYRIRPRGANPERAPTAFTLSGSVNGTTFTVIDTRSGIAWTTAMQEFAIAAYAQAYTYFRLDMTANNVSQSNFAVAELELLQGEYGDSVNVTYDATNGLITNMVSGSPAPMELRSNAFSAASVPSKGSVFALVKATTGAITPNTNLLADISRDGGTTWTTGTLVAAGAYGGFTMYEANGFDISGQPSGTSMKWRLRTVGTALAVAVDAVVAQWG